jgi:hypothetical protein
MLNFMLGIPVVLAAFVWGVIFPKRPATGQTGRPSVPGPAAPSAESQEDGHEVSDASPKVIGLFVVGLFAMIFAAMGALGWMYVHLYAKTNAIPVEHHEDSFMHAPRVKTSIAEDWDAIDAQAHARLDNYGWVDRARSVVHLPITRALELVAKEGLPARAGQTPFFPPPDQEKLPLMDLESTADATKFDPHQ